MVKEYTYSETLRLMKEVSRESFNANKRMYFTIITQHLNHLIRENSEELIQYLKRLELITDNRSYLYDKLFPIDLEIDTKSTSKLLQIVETRSDIDLQYLRGRILGLLAVRSPDLLLQRINASRNNQWTNDQFIGILNAIWIYLFSNTSKKVERSIINFIKYCLLADDPEVSYLALGITLRYYFDNSMNLRGSIKKYYRKSLDNKFHACKLLNLYISFIDDERFIFFIYNNLYKEILQSQSSDIGIEFCYLLVDLIEIRKTPKVISYQNKYQNMIKNLVFSFVKNNWWEIIEEDDCLKHFGLTDIQLNGKHLKRLLKLKSKDHNLFYLPQIILKSVGFNIFLVDILNILKTNYVIIYLPTLSLLLNNISDEFERIQRCFFNLIRQIKEKISDKINIDELTNLKSNRYEDIIPNNKGLTEFIKKLESLEFQNKDNEIRIYSQESNNINTEMETIMDLFNRIEPLILETTKYAWWIDMSSILKRINTSTIYQKISIYKSIILDLQSPHEEVNPLKVRENFNTFCIISKFFTENWLNRALSKNLTHPLIKWLNSLDSENRYDGSSQRKWPLLNILNLEHSVSFFEKINDQGTSTVMDELRKERNFFDALVHLQLAKKFKQFNKYNPTAEEKINGKPVDLTIELDGVKTIIEVTSIDMYQPLKYSTEIVEIRDKVLEKLLFKTKETAKIKNLAHAIILIIDTTRSPESELSGLMDALRGYKKISRIFFVNGQHIRGSDADEPETSFTQLAESKNISAVICLNTVIEPDNTRFQGHIFNNKRSDHKIPLESLKELGSALFNNENCIIDMR